MYMLPPWYPLQYEEGFWWQHGTTNKGRKLPQELELGASNCAVVQFISLRSALCQDFPLYMHVLTGLWRDGFGGAALSEPQAFSQEFVAAAHKVSDRCQNSRPFAALAEHASQLTPDDGCSTVGAVHGVSKPTVGLVRKASQCHMQRSLMTCLFSSDICIHWSQHLLSLLQY